MKQIFSEITEFRVSLVDWYQRYGRRLPWRENWDPYSILVSELMLQQTQVTTVVGYYGRWFERFPTLGDLANASEPDVLRCWQGLGYYARARNLHEFARKVMDERGGRIPSSVEELVKLPGVGRYTAGAIASFAYNAHAPIVDANVERVASRLLNLNCPVDEAEGRRQVWHFATEYALGENPRILNSALMELGAMLCRPRKPLCLHCPVRGYCAATDPETLPRKKARVSRERKSEAHFIALSGGGERASVLLQQSCAQKWRGLWILPELPSNSRRNDDEALVTLHYPITRFLVRLRVFKQKAPDELATGQAWHLLQTLPDLPMASPHRRALLQAISTISGDGDETSS